MRTLLIFLVTFFAIVACEDFNSFKKTYNKSYASKADEIAAEQNYKTNAAAIDQHNKAPNSTYKQSTNSHSDEPTVERKYTSNTHPTGKSSRNISMPHSSNKNVKYAYPDLLDYSK